MPGRDANSGETATREGAIVVDITASEIIGEGH